MLLLASGVSVRVLSPVGIVIVLLWIVILSRTAGAPTEPSQARTEISEQDIFMSLQG